SPENQPVPSRVGGKNIIFSSFSRCPGVPGAAARSLDRALEEAAVSGTLSLSGRKLRDYPRASAANHDLSDTTQADLSRNRLSELPAEACHFVSLEILNLYQNCIRHIPEAVLNLQSLTFLNISRNQLSTLPVHLCRLPLKVLIASNNKLVSIPEEIGHLRQLTELDVSCNEIQTIPPQIGNLESLRDLNVRRNNLVRLPEELAELPLIRLDFSCNKITTIPVCYRNLRHLQTIMLENNPLQSPPAQICIKGKIHIFKYLNIEACKIAPDLPDYDRRPMGFGSCHEELYSGRPYGALDSGFNSVDSGDKRWSGNEPTDEFSDLPLRVAEITKEQRLRRESQYQENRGSAVVTNGGAPRVCPCWFPQNIESRLKVSLPSDLGAALTDGVVLCHLANHVRPRSVPSIHVPSPAVPKLTMAKCRRNVENFLEACRRIGVPQVCISSVLI
uniref:Leucine rich repeats and calponin homology domain containing 3 n=1 Tax=Zosterops lateralis melanops TaxID=1220523 RepID=A0A8D2PEL1_ZOSLA